MSPIWWFLILLLLVLLYFGWRLRRRAPVAAPIGAPAAPLRGGNPSTNVGINSVVLSVTPTSLPCGSNLKFTCTISATGWSADGISRGLSIELLDDDPLDNDLLDRDPTPPATIPMVMGGPVPGGLTAWSVSHTNIGLYCDDCTVAGPDGSSDESDPNVFARLRVLHDTQPYQDSNTVQLRCTDT